MCVSNPVIFDAMHSLNIGKALAEAHVYPTASVQVEGYMSVRVTPKGSTTGLKSVTKLHASTFVDGRIEVDGGKLVKAEVKYIQSLVPLKLHCTSSNKKAIKSFFL